MNNEFRREALGWGPHFLQQLSLEEYEHCRPGRILQQHKSQLQVAIEEGLVSLRRYGLQEAMEGKTSLEEVLESTQADK